MLAKFNQKIIKSDFLKKSLIGGLTFGAKGAFIGALLTGIKEDELITHVTLYLKIKNVKDISNVLSKYNLSNLGD